jgi:hypothetical protein
MHRKRKGHHQMKRAPEMDPKRLLWVTTRQPESELRYLEELKKLRNEGVVAGIGTIDGSNGKELILIREAGPDIRKKRGNKTPDTWHTPLA